jgi:uncharacterized membrane protein (UPF0182 family)
MRTPLPRVSRRGRVTIVVLAIVFLLFTLLDRVVEAWTDYLWFNETHYSGVFTKSLSTRLGMFAVFGIGIGLVIAANLYAAYRLRPLLRPTSAEQHTLDRYRMLVKPNVRIWIVVTSVLVGLFTGLSAQGHWQQWLLFSNSQKFGTVDPQYKVDIGYYIFEYPFWRYLVDVGFTAVVIAVLGALAMHYLFGGVRLQGAGDRMTAAARAHLTGLVAVFVLLKAVAYFLDRRGLLLGHNNSGVDIYGGFYTDINALLPAKEILSYISIVVAIAILVFSNAWMRNLLWPGVALGLLVISAVAIGGIYPAAVQAFTVKPSPLAKESQYIQRSIDATRRAYGLVDTQSVPYPATTLAPPANLPTDTATVSNIRLLDPAVVSDTFTQLQQVRGFYNFTDKLDIDRYTIGGALQDYVVGAREIDYSKPNTESNWQNRHTIYTHGYGFVAAPANQIVCGGQPYFVSGFLGEHKTEASGESCASPTDLITAEQPRIYYGEQMDQYAVVGKAGAGKDAEFDRPAGAAEQYSTYDGSGGVKVGSFGRRLLYALKYKESNFLLSSVFNDNSKLLYVRNPRERVEKVAPFLTLDGDPYPAVVGERVVWILDGYTTAATYPYSQRIDLRSATADAQTGPGTFQQAREDVNYLRNSVKATVDAYDGTVTLYSFDDSDPVLKTWNKAFGGKLIKPRTDVPPELESHLRYPEDQFKVQRDLLARFHVTDPKDFFSGQNYWQVPTDPANDRGGQPQPPYYLLAKFPGQNQATFQITAAVTPKNRQNLAALLSGSYVDGKPRLQVLELPVDTAIFGPGQVHQNMTSIPAVRSSLTLFESENSQAVYGNLLSLPISGGMLYVEPLYIKGKAANSYPLMRKVLLSYGKYVAYEDTLQLGLESLVKQATGQAPPTTTTPGGQPPSNAVAEAVTRVQNAINGLREAQKSGDPEAWGKAIKELDDALKAYEAAQKAAGSTPAPSGTPSAGASPGPSPPQ